ncbi:glycosyl hydrolase [Pseudoroseomonas globiformis]|uniref:Glycosyl hydrolase n=1 Tax=Teichococcus globiformis TaxID=2307229 RepID=A0ABV7G048_9PROT
MALLGVYVDNSAQHVTQFENWLGRKVDGIHGVVGSANWSDFVSSSKWAVDTLWAPTGRDVFWSVPLIVKGANLNSAANGDYNQHYKQVAENLLRYDNGNDPIYVRTGWEFNGSWFQWSAIGKEQTFIDAFREFVDTFRSVSDRFKFEWNVNEAYGGMDPAKAYPGDHYVDIVGMDFYFNPEWQNWDSAKAFEHVRDQKYGLQWLEDFAKAHGKPTAYSEWGAKGNDAAGFIKAAQDWFESHNVVYQSYWDSNAQYPGRLSDGSDGNTGAAFKSAFSGSSSNDVDWGNSGSNGSGNEAGSGSSPGSGSPIDAPEAAPPADAADPTQAASGAKPSGAWTSQSWGSAGFDDWSGTDGNDWYQSQGGGDIMRGGAGDDTYSIFSSNDRVIEHANGGIDTVWTWIHEYTLPEHVENLTFHGWGHSRGTGNGSDNILTGNEGNNVLNGMGGNDILTGNGGADTFVIGKSRGHDTITDFTRSEGDKLLLTGFGNGASLSNDGDVWSVRAADGSITEITISGVTSLHSSDYNWG